MIVTLTSKEFDEAVLLWLKEQGFSADRYNITTRVIAGRSDGGAGTRIEATLEPKSMKPFFPEVDTSATRRFGQGHSDE